MNDNDPLRRALSEAEQTAAAAFGGQPSPSLMAAFERYGEAVRALIVCCAEETQQTMLHLLTNNLYEQQRAVHEASRKGRGE